MKDQFKKGLSMLQSKVTWLAKNKKINQGQLKDYNFMIKVFTEFFNYSEKRVALVEEQTGEYDLQLARFLAKEEKLYLLLRMTGFRENVIDDFLKVETHYLKNELEILNESKAWIQTDLQVRVFFSNYRSYQTLINADMQTVYEYEDIMRMKRDTRLWKRFLETYYENFPHLSHYFKQIDAEGKFNPYFKPHLYNALDSRYLWKN